VAELKDNERRHLATKSRGNTNKKLKKESKTEEIHYGPGAAKQR
jgi:hypothetical protein